MSDSVSHVALKKLNSQHFLNLGGLLDWVSLSDTEQGLCEGMKRLDHIGLSSDGEAQRKGNRKADCLSWPAH